MFVKKVKLEEKIITPQGLEFTHRYQRVLNRTGIIISTVIGTFLAVGAFGAYMYDHLAFSFISACFSLVFYYVAVSNWFVLSEEQFKKLYKDKAHSGTTIAQDVIQEQKQ